jgi:hypothetical protein
MKLPQRLSETPNEVNTKKKVPISYSNRTGFLSAEVMLMTVQFFKV